MFALLLTFANAHSTLVDPPPRYPSNGLDDRNKACPCGVGESNRLCDVASDRSDPDRSDDVTTYAAGETITVRWHEPIGHAGRWRIAFDPDGADLDDFNANILADVVDPAGDEGNTGLGDLWELEVTLPSTPCDNCTLQLVQMMDGDTSAPVPDPAGRSSYYQCADLVLVGDGPPPDEDTGGCSTAPGPLGLWLLGVGALGLRRRITRAG